ncbi:hypothetical protein [Bradyrhizobium japonicum]|uniref:hypothetical protein n=1 Tax=Bradyrhizobium japonicum TaxID=375 RepID=UPI002B4984E5|nr:hypothetical protein [Bradyrhizobium japonicum]WRI93289.1 hypothetical protein R3F75_21090 [Bradyrhizobium japonicum]
MPDAVFDFVAIAARLNRRPPPEQIIPVEADADAVARAMTRVPSSDPARKVVS